MPGTPLSGIREVVERSIFHSIRIEIADKGYIPDVLELITNPITALGTGLGGNFRFAGNFTGNFLAGRTFTVTGSTGNDGTYTILSSIFGLGETIVVVIATDNIPDATVDGDINVLRYYNDATGVALYETDLATIRTTLGYAVEIFGVGSSAARHLKQVPRIVVVANRTLPGTLGGNPDRYYQGIGPDPLNPTSYTASIRPPQTVNFQYDIHIISKQARQSRVMHELVALGLPKRGYLDTFGNPDQKLFSLCYSYRDIPNPNKGLDEQIYLYEIQDIFETLDTTVQTLIAPLSQITIQPWLGDSVPPGNSPTNATPVDDFIVTAP